MDGCFFNALSERSKKKTNWKKYRKAKKKVDSDMIEMWNDKNFIAFRGRVAKI